MSFWKNRKKESTFEPELVKKAIVEPLKPGDCECGHGRCFHLGGTSYCGVGYRPKTESNPSEEWSRCACQIFILDEDDDDGSDEPDVPTDPEIIELRRLSKL